MRKGATSDLHYRHIVPLLRHDAFALVARRHFVANHHQTYHKTLS
jgi:hypothetical protein